MDPATPGPIPVGCRVESGTEEFSECGDVFSQLPSLTRSSSAPPAVFADMGFGGESEHEIPESAGEDLASTAPVQQRSAGGSTLCISDPPLPEIAVEDLASTVQGGCRISVQTQSNPPVAVASRATEMAVFTSAAAGASPVLEAHGGIRTTATPEMPGPGTTLLVSKLPESADSKILKSFFEGCGFDVESATVIRHKDGGSRCFGFVRFASFEQAATAKAAMERPEFKMRDGRTGEMWKVEASWAKADTRKANRRR